MIDLCLQILRVVITQPLSQERADNGSRPTDEEDVPIAVELRRADVARMNVTRPS